MTPLRLAASALMFAVTLPALTAQVVISEIEFQPRNGEGQWIELANLSSQTVVIGGWSLYQATMTVGRPQNYWYAFPPQTAIAPGKFLRVHWLAKIKPSTKTDVFTGNTLFHFLFGLFAEKLDRNRGALALFNTQINRQMNDPQRMLDWVSWGTTGFKREKIAIQGKRWTQGSSAPPATGSPAPTLAYDYDNFAGAHRGKDWFRDFTPTPGKGNLGGAFAVSYGKPCQGTLDTVGTLVANGKPTDGNRDFYLGIGRPLRSVEFVLALLNTRGNGQLKLFGCPYQLLSTIPATVLFVPKTGAAARLRFGAVDPKLLAGLQFAAQFAIADVVHDKLGLTNGVEMRFSK